MNFLMPILGLIALVYLTGGWIGIPESYRLTVALVVGGILGVLGTIGIIIDKKSAEDEKKSIPFTVTRNVSPTPMQEDLQILPLKPSRLIIHYQDGKNEETERTIHPQQIEYRIAPNGLPDIAYLTAYCELRKQPRTFRVDRIEAAYDADTGEVLPNIPAALWRQTGKMLNI